MRPELHQEQKGHADRRRDAVGSDQRALLLVNELETKMCAERLVSIGRSRSCVPRIERHGEVSGLSVVAPASHRE